jgi:hypothetical protein
MSERRDEDSGERKNNHDKTAALHVQDGRLLI